jgi:hypothetical protein
MDLLHTLKPAVERRWLYVAAALLWGAAGLMLCGRAYGWLIHEPLSTALPLALAGIASGVVIYRVKFSRIAARNVKRIENLSERASIFAFQSPLTYLLIALMIGLGIELRRSSIPKPYLAVLYIGIGLGLLLSSGDYFQHAA